MAGLSVAVTAFFSISLACTSTLNLPPTLGDCIAEPDAACSDPVTGVGSIQTNDAAAAQSSDTGAGVSDEGGSCGMADTMLVPPCAPCVITNCCMADTSCSADSGCLSLLQCVASGQSGCTTLSPTGTQAYDDLAECIQLFCATQCQLLTRTTGGDP